MTARTLVRTGTHWEPIVGYCRAVRVGKHVAVSGCAPVDDDGNLVGVDDAYVQAQRCIAVITAALESADCGLQDVVRTRIFVTDISRWNEVGRAHAEAFADISPATTMVEVSRLIGDGMLVEIEADAIISDTKTSDTSPNDE